ncbi:hypothetical protein HDU98_006374 [Podochytrium sp. JEL0797]|nr:hypothetical protein HDU98_006374 [Podochytrium sp. JEL0797]
MVLLVSTPRLESAAAQALDHLKSLASRSEELEAVKTSLEEWTGADKTAEHLAPIDHSLVRSIARLLKDAEPPVTFEDLVKGSKMSFESPKPRVKSKELLELLEKARIKAENAEYSRMTDDLIPKHSMTQLTRQEKFEWNSTVGMFSGIMNVVLSMAAVFMAVFWVGDTITTDIGMVRFPHFSF